MILYVFAVLRGSFRLDNLSTFGDPVRLVIDCTEKLSTRQLVHSRIVSIFYKTKFLTALVTGQENPAEAQLPCFPDEDSKAESLLVCSESHEEELFDWARQRRDASAQ